MPLAFPLSAHPSSNFSEPAIAVTIATSLPGEDAADFKRRIASRGPWGQSEIGRHRVELVFTSEAAARLVEVLESLLGSPEPR